MLSASKRLQKEAQVLKNSPNDDVRLNPTVNIMEWDATIVGPKDSFYDGYEFDLKIQIPSAYPMQPPVIKFVTKIFHPNVMYEVWPLIIHPHHRPAE
jgi:ubiquitin-protein ligase